MYQTIYPYILKYIHTSSSHKFLMVLNFGQVGVPDAKNSKTATSVDFFYSY